MTLADYDRIAELVAMYHYSPSIQGLICKGFKLDDCPSESCTANVEMLKRLEALVQR